MKTGFAQPAIVTHTGQAVSATMPIKGCEALLGAVKTPGRCPVSSLLYSCLQPKIWNMELRAAPGGSEGKALKRRMEAEWKGIRGK